MAEGAGLGPVIVFPTRVQKWAPAACQTALGKYELFELLSRPRAHDRFEELGGCCLKLVFAMLLSLF